MDSFTADNNDDAPAAVKAFGVGFSLRIAREQKGLSLSEVAKQLRIRQPFLQALEEGRHRELPGGTYAIGFLRTYAEFLGLDGEEMIRRFRDEADDLLPRMLHFPSPESEGRIPGGAVLFLGLLLAGIAYGGWYWLSSRDNSVAEMVPPIPDRLNSVLNRPANLTGEAAPQDNAAAPPSPAPENVAAAATSAPAASMPASDGTVTIPVKGSESPNADSDGDKKDGLVASATSPAAASPTAVPPSAAVPPLPSPAPVAPAAQPVAPAPASTASAVSAESKPAEAKPTSSMVDPSQPRIVLKANVDDCWVQIRELDGQLLMSRLLHRGESYAVPNRPGLSLMVGNAGALDILVDGAKAPSLGAGGQVRRDIKLDPDKLLGGG